MSRSLQHSPAGGAVIFTLTEASDSESFLHVVFQPKPKKYQMQWFCLEVGGGSSLSAAGSVPPAGVLRSSH